MTRCVYSRMLNKVLWEIGVS